MLNKLLLHSDAVLETRIVCAEKSLEERSSLNEIVLEGALEYAKISALLLP